MRLTRRAGFLELGDLAASGAVDGGIVADFRRLRKTAPIALAAVLAVAPCFMAAFLRCEKDLEGLAAFDADGVLTEQTVVLECVDALAGGEGVAAEALLDQIAHADDAVGGYVVKRLAFALGEVDAVAGAVAPRRTLPLRAVPGTAGALRMRSRFGFAGCAVAVVLGAGNAGDGLETKGARSFRASPASRFYFKASQEPLSLGTVVALMNGCGPLPRNEAPHRVMFSRPLKNCPPFL